MRMERKRVSNELYRVLILMWGLFSIFCAVRDYDWFMVNSKAWVFVKIFGRNGARVFYVILGIFLAIAALFFL